MKKFFFILFIFSCWSCAQVSPPKGGLEDVTPPKLLKSSPKMSSIYFDNNGFQLEFDEIVDLDNINGQLIISPPFEKKPTVKWNKRKITVHFDNTELQENTTYTFNFGSAIKDHNEGNVLANFTYVFSTGSYIDSLSISGKITDAFTDKSVEKVLVLMYRNLEDSMPLTSIPSYFGISDIEGRYSINNLKEGVYKLFALLDMNQNYKFDLANESVAFIDEFIILDSNLVDVDFRLFNEVSNKQYITERDVEDFGRINYTFNKGLKDLKVTLKDAPFERDEYKQFLSKSKDTLEIWFPDYDGTFLMILNDDSSFADTTELKITPVFNIDEMPPFRISPNTKGQMDLNKSLVLQFDNPITSWNPDFISLYEDSIKVEIKPFFSDSLKRTLIISNQWKEKSKYLLNVGLGSFTDFYDQTNDLFELRFGAQEASFYGRINVNVDLGETLAPFIIQLLNESGEVLDEQIILNSQLVSYDYLRPAEYSFRLIQDLNNNGKWDTGNYSNKTQPEPVIYYPTKTNVRSNWDIDLTWAIIIK